MIREIIESVAIALVIAFIFRTFVAEMFMIPTGSMAPTLFGQHKDFQCPKCTAAYQVGASVERDSPARITQGTCPNCGYTINFREVASTMGKKFPTYSGDRIVVGKYPYRLTRPERWDVAVFLCPGNASMNYIKRVVGLPGETLRIHHGDIFFSPHDPELRDPSHKRFRMARKPPEKILATMLPVYDNNCQSDELRAYGWPARWSSEHPVLTFDDTTLGDPLPADGLPAKWLPSNDGKVFTFAPEDGNTDYAQLEYRHYMPRFSDWTNVRPALMPDSRRKTIRPRLITDMTAYNTGEEIIQPEADSESAAELGEYLVTAPSIGKYGYHWVGDLIAECRVEVLSRTHGAKFAIGLTKGGYRFWCEINLETGEAELSIPSAPDEGDVPLPGLPGKVARLFQPQWMAESSLEDRQQRAFHQYLAQTSPSAANTERWAAAKETIPGRETPVSLVSSSGGLTPPEGGMIVAPTHAHVGRSASVPLSGEVDFPPPPKLVGRREVTIPEEIVIRDVRTGQPDLMQIDRKYEVPVYEYVQPRVGAGVQMETAGHSALPEGAFYIPRGQTEMSGVRSYHVRFANVDNQLHLWVNDRLIRFDQPTAYCDLGITQPLAEDLRPVIIRGCCAKLQVSDLKIFRDIYYISAANPHELTDFETSSNLFYSLGLAHEQQWDFYCNPKYWKAFQNRLATEFRLETGQYFMLGDNSAASSDCRIWKAEKYVREELLIGEAYYVYWPHPWRGFIPNYPQMRKIR